MNKLTKIILISLLFSHLLVGCKVFKQGDCGFDEQSCGAIGQPGHGSYEIMVEPGITLTDKLETLEKQEKERREKVKKILEEQERQASERAQKQQELTKAQEVQKHNLQLKNGKIFIHQKRAFNFKEIKKLLELITGNVGYFNDEKQLLDEECKEDISNTFIQINKELKGIQEEIDGIERCLHTSEKSPYLNNDEKEKDKKDLELAKRLIKDLERYQEELYKLLKNRRAEINNNDLNAICLEKTTLHEAASAGDVELVQRILAQRGSPIDSMDNQGNTALSLAVEKGHLDLVKLLMKAGASFKHPKNWSLLHWAAYHGQLAVVRYLVEEKNILPLTFDSEGNTALILALGNKHEAVVSYLRGKTHLPTFYAVLKEDLKKRLGGQMATSVQKICEYANVDPADFNIEKLIEGFVESMQTIAENGKVAYAIPSNQLNKEELQEGESALQPQVSGILQDLLNELKRYSPNLSESNQKKLDKLSIEKLQPRIAAFVKRVHTIKKELIQFSQEQERQTQEKIERMKAETEKLEQQVQQVEQAAVKVEVQKREYEEKHSRYELATKNIAVPSVKYFFIPNYRQSNVKGIIKYMKFIQEDIAQNTVNTPLIPEQQQDLQSLLQQIAKEEQELAISYRDLKNYVDHRDGDLVFLEQAKKKRMLMEFIREDMTQNRIHILTDEQQQDLQVLLVQIYEDGEELISSYKDIKNYVEHRGGYQEFLKRAKQKGILEEEAIKIEAACINRKLENTQLAKQLLEELQSIKKEAYEILKNNQEDVSNYIGAHQYDAHFENDYSKQELVHYIGSYGLKDPSTKYQLDVAFFKDRLIEAVEKELMGKVIVDRAVLERIFQKAYQLAEKAQPALELKVQFFEALKKYWVLELQNTLLKSSKTKMDMDFYSEIFNDVYRKTAQAWDEEAQKEQAFIATLRDMFQHSTVAILQKIGAQEPVDTSYILPILQAMPLKAHIEKYYPSHQVIPYRDRHDYVTGLVMHSLFTAVPVSLVQTIQHKKLNDVKKQANRLRTGVSAYLR